MRYGSNILNFYNHLLLSVLTWRVKYLLKCTQLKSGRIVTATRVTAPGSRGLPTTYWASCYSVCTHVPHGCFSHNVDKWVFAGGEDWKILTWILSSTFGLLTCTSYGRSKSFEFWLFPILSLEHEQGVWNNVSLPWICKLFIFFSRCTMIDNRSTTQSLSSSSSQSSGKCVVESGLSLALVGLMLTFKNVSSPFGVFCMC